MKIVRAKGDDASTLSSIALSAKRHWRYPERWLEIWRESLTVRAGFIAENETYAAVVDGRAVGFYALRCEDSRARLEHLWVLPDAMNQGVGRTLFMHAVERAKGLGFRSLEIQSDPNAEGFYQRLGARRVGVNMAELDGKPTIRVRRGSGKAAAGLLTQEETAAILGLSVRAIREIERRAFEKLRRAMRQLWREHSTGEVKEAAASNDLAGSEIAALFGLTRTPLERQALTKLLTAIGTRWLSEM